MTSIKDCQKCKSKTKATGNRKNCTRTTCKIPNRCWQHVRRDEGLAVKKSTITGAGQGLFATRDFKFDRKKKVQICITKYAVENEYMSKRPIRIDEDPTYVWCRDRAEQNCYNAVSTQSTIGRYANACDRPGSESICNAKINKAGNIVPTRNIKAGDEILVRYSSSYWNPSL